MEGSRHKATAQQGRNVMNNGYYGEHFGQNELYRIPVNLCVAIEAAIYSKGLTS